MYPKIYAATDVAAMSQPPDQLDGTLKDAQRYVDRITRSVWWQDNCPPNFRGQVPKKVLLKYGELDWMGAATVVVLEGEDFKHRGNPVPLVVVGPNPANGTVPSVADPWVLLHELAHVWEYQTGHTKNFLYAYTKLVGRYLGINHLSALVDAMKDHKIRLNYRRIEWPN